VIKHLVSRVLLRRFPNHPPTGPVGVLDLDTLVLEQKSLRRLGGVEDASTAEPDQYERVWSDEVEVRLPHAFSRLDAGETALFGDPAAVETIKNAVALHWARGFAIQSYLQAEIPRRADEATARLLEQFSADEALHALTGVHVQAINPEQLVQERVRQEFEERFQETHFTDEQFLTHYRTGQQKVAPYTLEVWHSPTEDFLIADVPVVAYDKDTDRVGIAQGVSWDKADALYMVLGPHHVVALSQTPRWHEADSRMVEALNVFQVRGAVSEVYFRPASGLGALIAEALRANAVKLPTEKP